MEDKETMGSGPADPQKMREFWIDTVRPAVDRGKLEKVPTIKATTTRERDIARNQNHWLSRKSYGAFHDNYERIRWHDRGH